MARSNHSSMSFFTEEFPDGFRDDEPTWLAYCPDSCEKRTLSRHQDCPYFAGTERDKDGSAVAFRCALRQH